jgi:hypothetical protein
MDLEAIKAAVREGRFIISSHADQEAAAEEIDIAEIREALLHSEVLEVYPDTGRGESCLVLGFAGARPIHVVCGWRQEKVVVITVYVPKMPKFQDPRTRWRLG